MEIDDKPWKCESCGWIGPLKAYLVAPNPFSKEADDIYGCPTCFNVGDHIEICEIEGCEDEAHCGGQFKDGVYRRTCGKHAEWLKRATATVTPAL